MEKYLVGGAVRDMLLGTPVKDKDYVVINSSHEDMIAMGFTHCGKDFLVYLDNQGEEHALARTERKTEAGYHGFQADYANVTLAEDLLRRDLTINSMAFDEETKEVIDPHGGRHDLENRLLRHTSNAFIEDPIRVLRVARFAARYHDLGFKIADETQKLMVTLSKSDEFSAVRPQRVWLEFEKALGEKHPEVFFKVLHECGALKTLMPDVDRMFSTIQSPKSHPEGDVGIHSLMVLEQMKRLTDSKELALAAFLHDIGKVATPEKDLPKHLKHEKNGLPLFNKLADKYFLPNRYKEISRIGIQYHTHIHNAFVLKPSTILRMFIDIDAFRKPERVKDLCMIGLADSLGTGNEPQPYPQKEYIIGALEAATKIDKKKALAQKAHPKVAIEAARLEAIKNYAALKLDNSLILTK
ncbi:multifunctional CCA addition/repair protein [Vibrio owensii]|uniref:multifunctional CCA addition/repair protein n=1 Tax=Vibrio owensii TaxID=696485 RepID=UPI003CC60761